MLVNYDSKQTGQTATAPHIRVPGARDKGHVSRFIGGLLLSRVAKGPIPEELVEGRGLAMGRLQSWE